MDDVTSTVGIVALAAAGCAVVALAIALVLAIRIRRVRAAQRAVLGEGPPRDLAEYARSLERQLAELREHTDRITDALGARAEALELGLEGAITHAAVVRYDAYNEMSGMQSSSVALLDRPACTRSRWSTAVPTSRCRRRRRRPSSRHSAGASRSQPPEAPMSSQ